MRIPNFRRFTPEDYQQFASQDGERFLEHLNDVFEGITTALQGKLSFEHNFNTEIKTLSMEHDVEYTVGLKRLRGRCIDVWVLDPEQYEYAPNVAWEHVSQHEINVRVAFDSAPTSATQVTLLFLGE